MKSKTEYLVYHEGLIQGPFDLDFIEAMVMSGAYPPSIMIEKVGTTSQVSFLQETVSKVVPLDHSSNDLRAALAANAAYKGLYGATPKPLSIEALFAWGICIPVCLWLFWIFGQIAFNKPSAVRQIAATASTANTWNNKSSQQTLPQQVKPDIPRPVNTPPAPVREPGRLPGMKMTFDYTTSAPVQAAKTPTNYNQLKPLKLPAVELSRSYTPIQQPRLSKPSPSPEESTQIYRDSSGRVYRVSNSDYARLLRMKSVLDANNQTIDREQKAVGSLSAEIERSRRYLDRTSQYSVNSFNQKINSLNAKGDALLGTVDAYNVDVNTFNNELERVGTLIR